MENINSIPVKHSTLLELFIQFISPTSLSLFWSATSGKFPSCNKPPVSQSQSLSKMWKKSQSPALSWTHPRNPTHSPGFQPAAFCSSAIKKGKITLTFIFFSAREPLNTTTKAELTEKTTEIVETFTYFIQNQTWPLLVDSEKTGLLFYDFPNLKKTNWKQGISCLVSGPFILFFLWISSHGSPRNIQETAQVKLNHVF